MKNVADIYGLAPLQQLMLTHAVTTGDSGVLVEQFWCRLRGPLDSPALRSACEAVIRRHPLLRACFAWEGVKKPVQIIRERVEVPWHELDWRGMAADEQIPRTKELREQDRRRGFDLNRAPLTRFHLVRLSDSEWQFVWTCHHLVVDGWSLAVALRDVLSGYDQIRLGREPANAPPGKFSDYLTWLAARDTVASDGFWKGHLGKPSGSRRLPIQFTRTEQLRQQPGHDEIDRVISVDDTTGLKSLASHHHVGLNTLVQAAWTLMLAHHDGRDAIFDVTVGITVAGRPAEVPRIESLVGPLVNNIPLRVQLDWDEPLAKLLSRLQSAQVDVRPFEYCPAEQIARAAGTKEGCRLFETLVVFENYPFSDTGQLQIGTLEVCDLHGTTSSAFPLTLIAVPGTQLTLRLLFDHQRYSKVAGEQLLKQVVALLIGLIDQTEPCLRDISLLLPEDRADLHALARNGGAERVLDIGGRLAPIGMAGEVWTPDVLAGQLSLPDPCDPTDIKLRPTGYRGVLVADGTVEILGRCDAELFVGNCAANAGEIRAVLLLHPFVDYAAIVPTVDRFGETQLAAYIVPSRDAATAITSGQHGLLLEQVCRFVVERLPKPLVPSVWRALDALPIDPTGTVALDKLPPIFHARGDSLGPYVAPRDALEARLCAIWSDLLGVEPVGIADGFIELGGYSSLAVAMAARLEEAFGRRLSLASLIERPNVARLAELLRTSPGSVVASSLIPLRAQGSAMPLFCVHPAGGTVFCYLPLAAHLSADVPIYGLQAQGIDDDLAPHDSVGAMAAAYAKAIKTVQPSGPYRVCGWSTGGIIAFELARQLANAGDELELVALLDAAIPRVGETFAEGDLVSLLALLFPGEDPAQFEAVRERDADAQLADFRRRAERAQLLVTGASASQARRIYDVFQANMNAVATYCPEIFPGRLTILRAAQQATPMHLDPWLGWGPWAGCIEIVDLSSDHLAMFQEPGIREVAQVLGERLNSASHEAHAGRSPTV